MRRHISLAAILLALSLSGLAARPASACWYCTQKLMCNGNGTGCQPFALCTQATGFCTDCAITCTSAPGLCNHNAGDQCQWAQIAPPSPPIQSPQASLVARQCAMSS
jgi:hypothetical protein